MPIRDGGAVAESDRTTGLLTIASSEPVPVTRARFFGASSMPTRSFDLQRQGDQQRGDEDQGSRR